MKRLIKQSIKRILPDDLIYKINHSSINDIKNFLIPYFKFQYWNINNFTNKELYGIAKTEYYNVIEYNRNPILYNRMRDDFISKVNYILFDLLNKDPIMNKYNLTSTRKYFNFYKNNRIELEKILQEKDNCDDRLLTIKELKIKYLNELKDEFQQLDYIMPENDYI